MKLYSCMACILSIMFLLKNVQLQAQAQPVKSSVKYDTIIVKTVTTAEKKKAAPKPAAKAVVKETVIPTPEFINQPYYLDQDGNKLIKLENTNAVLQTRKKSLGLKGAKQVLVLDIASSKVRFTAKKDIGFIIKTSGDVIDLTSYIKLYQLIPADQKREVIISSKEGVLNDKEEQKGKLVGFSVKALSKDNYLVQFTQPLEAGEYGFLWVKNMEQKEFIVYAFGIDWKSSD